MREARNKRMAQGEKSRRTRERVLDSTVRLIRAEGLSSASPMRITQQTGMSWGAVQHHFGSKEQLLKTIVLLSRDQFNEAVAAQDYSGLDLAGRISLYVDTAWAHYHSDAFLASVEITFWHRNNGRLAGEDISGDEGRTTTLTRATVEKIFSGMGAATDKLVEATSYMGCVLTGLAFQEILTDGGGIFAQHLRHCKEAMLAIVRE